MLYLRKEKENSCHQERSEYFKHERKSEMTQEKWMPFIIGQFNAMINVAKTNLY